MANSIKGIIYDPFNSPLPNIQVQVFDRDLRTETLLGETKTNAKGQYSISYEDSSFASAEKQSADIFIKIVIRLTDNVEQEIAKSPIYFNVPEEYTLDFKIDGTAYVGLSEFDTLLAAITPLLTRQQGVEIHELKEDEEFKDISFLSAETKIDKSILSLLPIAFRHMQTTKNNISADIFYGLFRTQFPTKLNELLLVQSNSIEAGIKEAIKSNIISKKWEKEIPSIIKNFNIFASNFILDSTEENAVAFQTMIKATLPAKKQRKTFIDTYLATEDKTERFWNDLATKQGFTAKNIKDTQDILRINLITDQPELSKHLYLLREDDPDLEDIRGLAKFNSQDFERHITTIVNEGKMKYFPADISGETVEEKTKNYAKSLEGLVNKVFPTEVYMYKINSDNGHPFGRVKGDLLTFFKHNQGFDLNTSKIDRLLKESDMNGINDQSNLRQELKKINRIYKITPDYQYSKNIMAEGLNSAHEIVQLPKSKFVSLLSGGAVAEIKPASDIYDRAIQTDMITTALLTGHKVSQDNVTFATNGIVGRSADYQSMFGDNNLCECAHCQSVYSPSAYLVDMLNFMRINETSAYDALKSRRPDLVHILLTCKNTNTPLPYIDLVNELLENKIGNNELPEGSENVPQTNNSADELSAFPEHVQTDVYEDKLSNAFSSFKLPFNLPLEETRIYLDKLNCKRYELMGLFYGKKGSHKYSDFAIATEYLGLSIDELNVINGINDAAIATIPSNRVRDFLDHTGISFLELLQLLECNFINPMQDEDTSNRTISIVADEEDEEGKLINPLTCNVDYLSMEGLNDDTIRLTLRFIRLWKKLDWDVFDVDRVFTAFGMGEEDFDPEQNEVNSKLIVPISHIVRINSGYKLNIQEILTFWFDIETKTYILPTKSEREPLSSLYKILFQNKTLSGSYEDQLGEPESLGGDIESKFPILTAAFNISENDLKLISTFEINQNRIIDGQLNLQNLSTIYRYSILAKVLRLKVEEVLLLIKMTGLSPFGGSDNTVDLFRFIEKVKFVQSSGFSLLELRDLLKIDTEVGALTDPNAIAEVLSNLREGLQKIGIQFKEIENTALNQEKKLTAQKLYIIETLSTAFITDAKIIELIVNDLVRSTENNNNAAILSFLSSTFIESKNELVTISASDEIIWTHPELVNTYILLYQTWIRIAHIINKLSITSDEFIYLQSNEVKLKIAGVWNLPEVDFEQFTALENLINTLKFKKKLNRPAEDWFTIFDTSDIENNFFTSFKLLTGIEEESITELKSATTLNFTFPNDFLIGENLITLIDCASKAKELGSTVENLIKLTGLDPGNEEAQIAKHILKARYEEQAWLDIIKPISNDLRSKKRNALVSYLLTNAELADFRTDNDISKVNDLFAYFLIDMEMAPCMMTSRIKQAISSVQLYIDRCLLGLEKAVNGQNTNIELGEDFTNQWNECRKKYRVWEANRKVFLYPENWIEPDLRDDKTPFFKELESKLTQNEATDEIAKDALLEYLEKLDKVANLQVISFFHDKDSGISHFIGRTRNIPNEYFYRQREKSIWSPWEKIELDIQGNHILMVVWNNRLMVYWGAFTEKQDNQGTSPVSNGSGGNSNVSEAPKYLDMKLYWSEYKNNKWGSKIIADKSLKVYYSGNVTGLNTINKLFLRSFINDEGLYIRLYVPEDINWNSPGPTKVLYSMISNTTAVRAPIDSIMDNISFMRARDDNFGFGGGLGGRIHDDSVIDIDFGLVATPFMPDDTYHFDNCNSSPRTIHGINIVKDSNAVKAKDMEFDFPFLRRTNGALEQLLISGPGQQNLVVFSKGQTFFNKTPDSFRVVPSHYENEKSIRFFINNEKSNFYVEASLFQTVGRNRFTILPFYHPYVCKFISDLNTHGLDALYTKQAQKEEKLNLLVHNEYVKSPTVRNNPRGEVDFSIHGAYSIYNWELFFHLPLLIATRLSQNQKFDEARKWFHYIFDPTAPSDVDLGAKRFWITKPFVKEFDQQNKTLEELINENNTENQSELKKQIEYWQDNPFNPHAVARMRNSAYMRTTVMKYITNLLDWGDQLFRQDSIESINEATLLYILAANLLGEKPETILPRAQPVDSSFNTIIDGLGLFGAVQVAVESLIDPLDIGEEAVVDNPITMPLLCLPKNDKLLGYWDTVADKLFKIRNCMNIDGEVRQLALFQPPIDPAFLVRVKAAGLDLNAIMNDINAVLPNYRFQMILQKANELCNDVKSLGSQLLSTLEKKDSEAMALLRSGHELKMLELVRDIKKLQVKEAKENLNGIFASQENVENRKAYYENREYKNSKESSHLQSLQAASLLQTAQGGYELIASGLSALPQFTIGAWSWGVTTSGEQQANVSKLLASSLNTASNLLMTYGNIANTEGGYLRRQEDWDFQIESAKLELKQIDKQIIAAEIRLAIAEKDLSNHEVQMEQSQSVDSYLRDKFTNAELYNYMTAQISGIYFQTYQMAYDLAKKAEKCYQFELGIPDSNIIKFGYWDSLKKGLLSGEKLQLDLRRLEMAYIEHNKRDYELTRHISIRQLNPTALLTLKTRGTCEIEIPEWLLDMDCPGHYMRRIKAVSLSIPAIAGPYTSVNCTLSLEKSSVRKSTDTSAGYERDETIEDPRFRDVLHTRSSIVTSNAQNDSGLFEVNFRDERFLPFENAGVISRWTLELPTEHRQFDYNTITDVILHVRYMAKDGGSTLKDAATEYVTSVLEKENGVEMQRLFSLRHDFPSAWHDFLNPNIAADGNVFDFNLTANHFPYRDSGHELKINSITIISKSTKTGAYTIKITAKAVVLENISITSEEDVFGGLHSETKNVSENSLTLDFNEENNWKLEIETPAGQGANLEKDEIEEFFLIFGYEWSVG